MIDHKAILSQPLSKRVCLCPLMSLFLFQFSLQLPFIFPLFFLFILSFLPFLFHLSPTFRVTISFVQSRSVSYKREYIVLSPYETSLQMLLPQSPTTFSWYTQHPLRPSSIGYSAHHVTITALTNPEFLNNIIISFRPVFWHIPNIYSYFILHFYFFLGFSLSLNFLFFFSACLHLYLFRSVCVCFPFLLRASFSIYCWEFFFFFFCFSFSDRVNLIMTTVCSFLFSLFCCGHVCRYSFQNVYVRIFKRVLHYFPPSTSFKSSHFMLSDISLCFFFADVNDFTSISFFLFF